MNKPIAQLELVPAAAVEVKPALPPAAAAEPRRWSAEDPDVIIRAQPATSVYKNTYGSIVIMQESSCGDEDDPYVMIRPEYLPVLIAALKRYAQ